jgi:hypothetical protein
VHALRAQLGQDRVASEEGENNYYMHSRAARNFQGFGDTSQIDRSHF